MQALLVAAVAAHVGGVPTQARFLTPEGVGNEANAGAIITWDDGDIDPTGKFDFFYQTSNVPPLASLTHPAFQGIAIPEAQDILISETTNMFGWETSAIPAGSYFVYEITEDPPLMPIYGISHGPITVRHDGDPLWPAVSVLEPNGSGDIVRDEFAVRWIASGEGDLVADLAWGRPDSPLDPLTPLVEGVPMSPRGDGIYDGCFLWDLSELPQGYYFLHVTVRDSGGRAHAAYSYASLVVFRPTIDAGPTTPDAGVLSCESLLVPDGGLADAGTVADASGPGTDGGGGGDCGCAVGAPDDGASAPLATGIMLAGLLALRRTRRRRHPSRHAIRQPEADART